MQERTGLIVPAEVLEQMSSAERKEYIDIPNDELQRVQAMNRHDRRAWAAKQRKSERVAAK